MDDLQAAYDRLLFDLVISGEGAGQEAKNIFMTTDLAQSNSCPAFSCLIESNMIIIRETFKIV